MAQASIDVSEVAICDDCDVVFTSASPETGGMLFHRKALCPTCAPRWEASAEKYGETHFIADRAREGETFFDAVMRWRGGNHSVVISGPDDYVAETAQRYLDKGGKC